MGWVRAIGWTHLFRSHWSSRRQDTSQCAEVYAHSFHRIPAPFSGDGLGWGACFLDWGEIAWHPSTLEGCARIAQTPSPISGRARRKQLDGLPFRRQVPLGPYIVDFLCAKQRLIIEVDGGKHAGANVDRTRTAWLEGRGFRILRFWNNDVLGNLDGVIEAILLVLRSEASPPPHPAPIEKSRGRGKG